MLASALAGRRLSLAFALGLTSMALLGLSLAATSRAARTVPVSIVYRAYQPASTSIEVGDTVTWTNLGLTPHTVTAVGGTFDSGRMNAGASFSVLFSLPGTFLYSCTIHPTMKGQVIVRSAAQSGSTPSTTVPSAPKGGGSPSVKVALSREHTAHGSLTLVHVAAARPGARALLELSRPGHTSWRVTARARLSSRGKATFSLSSSVHRRLRVVVQGPGGMPPLISRTLPTSSAA